MTESLPLTFRSPLCTHMFSSFLVIGKPEVQMHHILRLLREKITSKTSMYWLLYFCQISPPSRYAEAGPSLPSHRVNILFPCQLQVSIEKSSSMFLFWISVQQCHYLLSLQKCSIPFIYLNRYLLSMCALLVCQSYC